MMIFLKRLGTEVSALVTNLHCKINVYAFFLRAFCSQLPCVTDFAQKLNGKSIYIIFEK